MDRPLRRLTPLVVLALGALVLGERWLPGTDAFAERFGRDALLRLAFGILCVYVALLVVERQRMESTFKQLLGEFRRFHSGGSAARPDDAVLKREAAGILVAALDSGDPKVRASARHNLVRLAGQDFGDDAARWRAWLEHDATPR
jgi:hypothetical protein